MKPQKVHLAPSANSIRVAFFSLLLFSTLLIVSCGGGSTTNTPADNGGNYGGIPNTPPAADEGRGLGEVKEVKLNTPLEKDRVSRGLAIYDMKCSSCHTLDSVRKVGPGWKDVTKRRRPEWIMNLVTNVDVMLDKDPEARKLLELCLTRMPNQNISIGDARDVLEYMRQNDGEK